MFTKPLMKIISLGCGFSNNKNYKRKIWDYKRADYLLMKQKISEIDWVNLITGACDIHGAAKLDQVKNNYLCDYQSVSVY
jgi:hypothetical protein